MLIRSGQPTDRVGDEQLAEMYGKHLAKVKNWLENQTNIRVIYLEYNQMLVDPQKSANQVNKFLGDGLDQQAMAAVVDTSLYRQRK
jgi:hypothetical protein